MNSFVIRSCASKISLCIDDMFDAIVAIRNICMLAINVTGEQMMTPSDADFRIKTSKFQMRTSYTEFDGMYMYATRCIPFPG